MSTQLTSLLILYQMVEMLDNLLNHSVYSLYVCLMMSWAQFKISALYEIIKDNACVIHS